MKRTLPVRVGLLALICVAVAFGPSSATPEPVYQPTDTNPQNPANWEFISMTQNGSDTVHRNEMTSETTYAAVTYYRDWADNQWYRNGVMYGPPGGFGPQLTTPVGSLVGSAPEVDFTSEGTVTLKIHWIGEGSPPVSVRLSVTGPIEIIVAEGGYAEGDDGFQSALDVEDWQDGHRYFVDTPVVQYFNVDANGYCQVVLEKNAIAESYEAGGYAFADARVGSLDVYTGS